MITNSYQLGPATAQGVFRITKECPIIGVSELLSELNSFQVFGNRMFTESKSGNLQSKILTVCDKERLPLGVGSLALPVASLRRGHTEPGNSQHLPSRLWSRAQTAGQSHQRGSEGAMEELGSRPSEGRQGLHLDSWTPQGSVSSQSLIPLLFGTAQ